MTGKPPITSPRSGAMGKGRQADSARRRQRVTTALDQALARGAEISVSGIACTAGVDRSFLYRHHDLLEKIHAAEATPIGTQAVTGPLVTRASLQADLLAAHERAIRLDARNRLLERRLAEALGEKVWRESGLGAPIDIDAVQQRVTYLEQQSLDLRLQLEERDEDLAAARATNRELMTRINTAQHNR